MELSGSTLSDMWRTLEAANEDKVAQKGWPPIFKLDGLVRRSLEVACEAQTMETVMESH